MNHPVERAYSLSQPFHPRRRDVHRVIERAAVRILPLRPRERVVAAVDDLERGPGAHAGDERRHLIGRPERIARAVQKQHRPIERRQVRVATLRRFARWMQRIAEVDEPVRRGPEQALRGGL